MKINEVEQKVGITKKNIRFYEQEGLLSPQRNAENGYREYSDDDVATLKQIKLLRKLSVPLDEIRKLQAGSRGVQETMRRQMIALQLQIDSLYHASLLCNQIDQGGLALDALDVDGYLDEMARMERDGVSFVNLDRRDTARQYITPVAVTLAATTLVMGFLYMLFWRFLADLPGTLVVPLAVVLPLATSGVVVTVMLGRVRQTRRRTGRRSDKGQGL